MKINNTVIILPYKDDPINREGRINAICPKRGYHVVNMNMPYIGTVCEWFKEEELELK